MPFDSAPTPIAPDLTCPSPAGLAYLLRHRELWPHGFKWDFREASTCAVGLYRQRWNSSVSPRMDRDDYEHVFCLRAYQVPDYQVTPEMVADRLDRLPRFRYDYPGVIW